MSALCCALLMVSCWCLHGVQVVPRWCLGGVSAASMLIQGVDCVLVVSWWRRVGVSGRLCWWSMVVSLWCFPARQSNLASVFLIGRATHQVVFNGCMLLSIMIAEDDGANAEEEDDGDDDGVGGIDEHDGDCTEIVMMVMVVVVVMMMIIWSDGDDDDDGGDDDDGDGDGDDDDDEDD